MLILLTGLPGSGKSTVAKLLAEKIQGTVISSDVIRRELFPTERTYSKFETSQVVQETERRAKESLSKGLSVILDTLFTRQEARDKYRTFATGAGIDFKMILVTSPSVLVKERLESRPRTNDPSEATYEIHLLKKKAFEPVIGEHVVINNDGDLASLSAKIVALDL